MLAEKSNEIVADQNEVLIYLTEVMRGNIKDQFELDAPLKERNKAAELLGKRYALFVDVKDDKSEEKKNTILGDILNQIKNKK